jgi:hypothetical protein
VGGGEEREQVVPGHRSPAPGERAFSNLPPRSVGSCCQKLRDPRGGLATISQERPGRGQEFAGVRNVTARTGESITTLLFFTATCPTN